MNNCERNVWCLLGLPFDAVTMDETIERIYHSVRTREKCFISTPNLNFLIESQNNSDFRNSVINSDLIVADGKPLIWLARLLNIPLPERVAGSDIIEQLIENKKKYEPIKVFFFGGQDGVAEKACEKLNTNNKGLKCVGFYNPGFGSVEKMSTIEIIDIINKSDADFIVVSLGAKKGQAWIEKNKNKLCAPVISHLGAVVNFISGSVKRSPKIMQKLGLEWLWRIKEEPALWSRYIKDASSFLKLLFFKVFPYFFLIRKLKRIELLNDNDAKSYLIETNASTLTMNLEGGFYNRDVSEIGCFEEVLFNHDLNIDIIMTNVSYIDGETIGKLLVFKKKLQNNNRFLCVRSSPASIEKIFSYNCCGYLLGNK